MHRLFATLIALPLTTALASPPPLPAALFTDPAPDKAHPASMAVLHIPSHGATINGVAYIPAGPGPHPVLVICHGLPGNEKNLDLAQAVRRAGWVAVTFNYRGSWGSPGSFSFSGNLEDAAAVLAYLRDPATAGPLRLDPRRIAIAGHSMGGWVTAKTAAGDPGLLGAVLISAADFGKVGGAPHERLVALMSDNMEALAGVTAESMASEVAAHAREYALANTADGLSRAPLLVLSADDGLAPDTDALITAVRARPGSRVTAKHVATDHGWSDRRIELEATIIAWLQKLR